MKKLFSRFSAPEPLSPTKHRNDQLDESKTSSSKKSTFGAARGKVLIDQLREDPRSRSDENEGKTIEPFCFTALHLDFDGSSTKPRAVPARVAGSSLPLTIDSPRTSSVEELSPVHAFSQPDANTSNGSLPAAPGPKMVIFAPSPEKQRTRPPAPVLFTEGALKAAPYATNNSSSSRFSRPTIASEARARLTARSSLAEGSQRDKYGGRLERPETLAASTRRSYSYTSSHDGRAFTMPGSFSDTQKSRQSGRLSLESQGAAPSSVSPNHSGFLRSSAPMQATGSGSSSTRNASRRSSLLPPFALDNSDEVITFPVNGTAPRSFGFPTWSAMTQEDLVRNLGPRERTRQEVLWEIVASEERYLVELEKARELYVDALLHPHLSELNRASLLHGSPSQNKTISPAEVSEQANLSGSELPIAARYMAHSEESSPSLGQDAITQSRRQADGPVALQSHKSTSDTAVHSTPATHSRRQLNYGLGLGLGTIPVRDRTAAPYPNMSTASLGGVATTHQDRPRPRAHATNEFLRLSVPLPPSLKEVLSAMSNGLLDAHETLSDALKARYEEQWPLVRSLADVFMKHSHMLHHYATYVCHLQRAMEELEEAALMERAFRGKKLRKERLSNTVGLGRTVSALESRASEQGFAGLSIFISMPFQRLLKYPLLFQNLLFHTDPSTAEFESTVAMVVEVERLVRSIEDEKVNVEERDKTRDAFARIDGITNKQVLRPKTDRVFIEELALYDENARRSVSDSKPENSPETRYPSDSEGGASGNESSTGRTRWNNRSGLRATLRNKRSYRRLSDFLSNDDRGTTRSKAPTRGSKNDLWVVRFSDMEIKCQRIGVTALPMVSTAALTGPTTVEHGPDDSALDFAARSKDSRERLKALRSATLRAKTRNLYRFISVIAWRSVVRRDDAVANRELYSSGEIAEEDEIEADSDTRDDQSSLYSNSSKDSQSSSNEGVGGLAASAKYIRSTKLSFTYWGDRLEPNPPGEKARKSSNAIPISTNPRPSGAGVDSATSIQRQVATSTNRSHSTQHRPGNAANRTVSGTNGGVSSAASRTVSERVAEPMTASSISTASESVQNVVALMHARQRSDKFGARLRPSLGPIPSTVSVPLSTTDTTDPIA